MHEAAARITPRVVPFDVLRSDRPQPDNLAPPSREIPAPLLARAHLAGVLATRIGGCLLSSDIAEHLIQIGAPDRPELDHLCAVFRRLDYDASRQFDPGLAQLPALAEMTTGQIVLVLSRQGDSLSLYDHTTPDRSAEVAVSDFTPHHTGWVLRVRLPFAEIETRHTEPTEAPHWFWSEFRHHRRAMAEVAVASLVANILATAISLYALQIYDRVIPNKSEPTLWVLTLGAVLGHVDKWRSHSLMQATSTKPRKLSAVLS